ncbi:cilia- and flagella-associated protein 70-like [Nylanderia fulva]|uniref:cilia- and flagella-associated protein 70-like n=1 Tax=Nylanderia fulva TaxID=613905 RepID=UPI0010FBB86E|nr:cilia- and flagella-associated protein 70-like [Nylanderia fulva]
MEESSVQDESIEASEEKSIKIIIESIENITMREETSVSFVVMHKDVVLGESIPLFIDPDFKEPPQVYDVNFAVELSFIINDHDSMNSVVSTPILIKVMCETQNQRSINSVKSNTDSKKKATVSTSKETLTSSNVIGFCSLDLMPILLGEKLLTERLIVQMPHLSLDGNAISWQNLPIINATMICDDEKIFPSKAKINFLSITIESIYNPPVFFIEDAEYKAGTIVYIDNEIPENVIFEDGKWTKYRDVERTKQWQSLSKLQSRARLSKWKLSRDYANIKNTLDAKFDLEKKVCQDKPRIEWNFMSRNVMYDAGIETMQKRIVKYKYWPFQFMMIEKNTEKDNIRSKETKCQFYQCYVDLSELVFPGTKSTRVIAQLYTHNISDMAEKTGLEKNILELWNNSLERDLKKSIQSEFSQNATPLISETDEPVFVIIEVELYYPFIPCRLETDFSDIIEKMMKPKIIKQPYIYSDDVAEEQYATCIQKLVEIITESYRDELTCFTQYLYKTGTYLSVRSTLKEKVISMLDQKFKTGVHKVHSTDSQNFVTSIYTYLVERMHLAINKIVESRLVNNKVPKMVIFEKLYIYAEEAYELGHTDDARRHHQTAIAINRSNPEAWTKYAMFLLKISDMERAKESCCEAVLLNRRDKIACARIYREDLLMYGLILAKEQHYREAEIFLKAVTDFYPRLVEGWVILHLLYIRMNYSPGTHLTLRIAEKCIKDDDAEMEISAGEDPLAWTTIYCPQDNVYMITATLLMKMGLYYEDIGNYERALKVFLNACRTSPTAETWLGAGIAFYELQRFTEAEAALSEANQIDNRNVTVWKYLCLLNMSLQRHDEFVQCRTQIAQCTLFILSLLQIVMFTAMINCDESRSVIRHKIGKKDDVERVKIKVFRGPMQEKNGDVFAPWGYWIQQPGR